ncbi:hypothetical protein Tco_1506594, partial [Tanacetum coccineum]
KAHFQNQYSKLVASRDKEVNMTARDSDDASICCVENTVEDRIMDSAASLLATYFKEELKRFKLRSSKVRLADDKTLDIAGVGDVVLKTSFGSLVVACGNKRRSLYMIEDWYEHVSFQSNVPDVRKLDIYFYKPGGLGKQRKLSFIMSVKTRKLQRLEQVHIEGYGLTFIASI